jgi:hypothetical protein
VQVVGSKSEIGIEKQILNDKVKTELVLDQERATEGLRLDNLGSARNVVKL